MQGDNPSAVAIGFGPFQANLQTGELRRDALRLRLPEQSFQVLAALLERPGELVTREELRQRLWPQDTFVDYDHSLNVAVQRLREALGDSATEAHYIETLPRRGYRFIAPVEVIEPARETRPWRRRGWALALVALPGALAVLLALNLGGLRDRLLGRPAPGETASIAVLPLENLSGDPEQEYFADGMTEALITELGKVSALRVISRTSAMQYKTRNKPLPEIAKELNVDTVVEGSLVRQGDRIRITVQLLRTNPEGHLWAESYERDLRDVLALQGELARSIARAIRVELTAEEESRLAAPRAINPEAHLAYLKGRYFQDKRTAEGMRQALAHFQTAVALDPGYAPAYVGIALSYAIGDGFYLGLRPDQAFAKTEEAALKAVALDDAAGSAHLALAQVKCYQWDFRGADRELQHALELSPGDAQAHQVYGQYLRGMGRYRESIQELQRALTLDPLSTLLMGDLGVTYRYAGQLDRALKLCREALQMDADSIFVHWCLASAYWRAGRIEEALEFHWPDPRRPDVSRQAQKIYQRAGRQEMLRWLVNNAIQRQAKGESVTSEEIAGLWTELGDKDQAFIWLEKAYQDHGVELWTLKGDPAFAPLRDDPRFQDLLRRMNLPN
jgi:TolB-like protein/DNA-binding winged helix-turn-helix (wHTH) protein